MPKLTEINRLLADGFIYGRFDRAKPVNERSRRSREFALRRKIKRSPQTKKWQLADRFFRLHLYRAKPVNKFALRSKSFININR